MSQISSILRDFQNNGLMFYCPGCHSSHAIYHGIGNGPRWTWNGDVDRPTFTPSIKVTCPANPDADEDFKEWRTERICHSYVTDGQIQFLSDCTHELVNQTVSLPKWPTTQGDTDV
jgi:hypothetical protein